MRYQVPQFIEVEDKIFGPFTFKQFIYMAGGAGICFMAYKLMPLFWGILVMIPAACAAAGLAFYKPNNRPAIEMLESAFNFLRTSKLYIWRRQDKKISEKTAPTAVSASILVPKISESKLKDLAWSLDINETIYSRESKKLETRDNLSDRLI
jgi:hypothetical protein